MKKTVFILLMMALVWVAGTPLPAPAETVQKRTAIGIVRLTDQKCPIDEARRVFPLPDQALIHLGAVITGGVEIPMCWMFKVDQTGKKYALVFADATKQISVLPFDKFESNGK